MKREQGPVVAPPAQCPLEGVVRLLAGAWTIKILWYLCQQPQRFGQLRRALGPVSTKILTLRLRTLEKRGLLKRRELASPQREVEYSISELGRELKPILDAMTCVAARLDTREGV